MGKRMTDEDRERYARELEKIRRFQERDPKSYALIRISCLWDDLNAQYKNTGISEEFKEKRKRLRERINSYIGSGVFSREDLNEWCSRPWLQDRYEGERMIQHGYNFNYK